MTADPLAMPAVPPEWRRSGPYLVLALAVHAAALAVPANLVSRWRDAVPPQTLTVRFAQPSTPAVPAPPAVAPARPAPVPEKPRQHAAPSRTVLAVPAQQATRPATFTVPDAMPPAPEAPPAPAPVAAAQASPAVTAARYDAAYLHNPRPVYPALSRRLGEEGKVVLKVRVGADGQPLAVDLDRGSNFPRLDDAARQVVARWRFVPARRGDEGIESSVLVPIVFRLDD